MANGTELSEVFETIAKVKRHGRPKAKPDYTPKWYGYGRVSTNRQLADSPEDQRSRVESYWAMKCKCEPELQAVQFGGMKLEPSGKSATKIAFSQRPAGRELVTILQPGDHLVCDKFDRLFRGRVDFAVTSDYLHSRGVILHFVNWMGVSIEMGTPMGDWILNAFANNAALEAAQIGDRVRRARKRRKEQGLWSGAQIPWCCVAVGENDKNTGINTRRLIYSPHIRVRMKEIVNYKDNYNLSFPAIARVFEKARIMQGGEAQVRPFWTPKRVFFAYWLEKAIQAGQEPDPNRVDLTKVLKDFKDKWDAEHPEQLPPGVSEAYGRPDPLPEPPLDDPDGIVFYSKKEMKLEF